MGSRFIESKNISAGLGMHLKKLLKKLLTGLIWFSSLWTNMKVVAFHDKLWETLTKVPHNSVFPVTSYKRFKKQTVNPQLYCLLLSHHERQPYCFPFNTMIKITVNYLQNTKQTMSIDYLVSIMERPSAKGWDVSLRRMNIGLTFIMWPEYKLQLIANVDVCLLVVIFGCKWDQLLKTCEHCSIWQVHCRIGSVALCSADYFPLNVTIKCICNAV